MSDDYVKLFGSILDSTIWLEDHPTVRVWITMLAMKNHRGVVNAAVPGLANRARVTLSECLAALAKFKEPDQHSRTKDFEGRRIAEIDGGWKILNHAKYRDLQSVEQKREADRERMRAKRANENPGMNAVADESRDTRDVAYSDPDPDPYMDPASRAQPLTLTSDPPKKPGRKRPSRAIPEGWQPDETAKKIARELNLDIAAQAQRFVDWHSARGSVFADWQAAFRTWLRRSREYMDRDATPRAGSPIRNPPKLAPSTPMQAFDPAEFDRVKKGAS